MTALHEPAPGDWVVVREPSTRGWLWFGIGQVDKMTPKRVKLRPGFTTLSHTVPRDAVLFASPSMLPAVKLRDRLRALYDECLELLRRADQEYEARLREIVDGLNSRLDETVNAVRLGAEAQKNLNG